MSDSLYAPSTYDRVHAKYTHEQSVAGGKSRARSAKRHFLYGFFLPNDVNTVSNLPSDYVHGRAGGLARAKQMKECKQ